MSCRYILLCLLIKNWENRAITHEKWTSKKIQIVFELVTFAVYVNMKPVCIYSGNCYMSWVLPPPRSLYSQSGKSQVPQNVRLVEWVNGNTVLDYWTSLITWCVPVVYWAFQYFSAITWFLLQWRHNGRDSVSNHQPHDCLLNRLSIRRSKKTSKLHVTGLCEGNSPGTGEFQAQMVSNAENVSIWWRYHVKVNELWFSRTYNKLFCSTNKYLLRNVGQMLSYRSWL